MFEHITKFANEATTTVTDAINDNDISERFTTTSDQVLDAEGALVGIGPGESQGDDEPLEGVDRETGFGGDLGRSEPLAVHAEDDLRREQRQAVLLDGLAEHFEFDAFIAELTEKLEPRLPLLALEAVEHPFEFKVGYLRLRPVRHGQPPLRVGDLHLRPD